MPVDVIEVIEFVEPAEVVKVVEIEVAFEIGVIAILIAAGAAGLG